MQLDIIFVNLKVITWIYIRYFILLFVISVSNFDAYFSIRVKYLIWDLVPDS